MHLNSGLSKLKETEEEVRKLQSSLDGQNKELQVMQGEVKRKISQIKEESVKADQSKTIAIKLAEQLREEQKFIKERLEVINTDLAQAEPALIAAKQSVTQITSRELNEIR